MQVGAVELGGSSNLGRPQTWEGATFEFLSTMLSWWHPHQFAHKSILGLQNSDKLT